MGYPPQGNIPNDVLRRNKISTETWEMLLDAANTKRLRKVLRRLLRDSENQNEE